MPGIPGWGSISSHDTAVTYDFYVGFNGIHDRRSELNSRETDLAVDKALNARKDVMAQDLTMVVFGSKTRMTVCSGRWGCGVVVVLRRRSVYFVTLIS